MRHEGIDRERDSPHCGLRIADCGFPPSLRRAELCRPRRRADGPGMNTNEHRFLSVAICDNLWRGLRNGDSRETAQEAPKKRFLDVSSGSDRATAIPGERVRPARRVWRPAKHLPACLVFEVNPRSNPQEPLGEGVGRETRPTAIGTIALPKPCRLAWSSTENVEEPKKPGSEPGSGFLCFFAAKVHSRWRSAGCIVSRPGRDGRGGGATLHQGGLIGRFSHFCDKSSQVTFYEQLTTKIAPFQLRLIEVN